MKNLMQLRLLGLATLSIMLPVILYIMIFSQMPGLLVGR